jgi:4-carboxymuconolactone decarboxylase
MTEARIIREKKNETPSDFYHHRRLARRRTIGSRRRNHPLPPHEGRAAQSRAEEMGRHDLGAAAKFVNPPYRAYIYNPDLANRLTAMSEYLRWNTSLPPRLSELAILITARQWTAQYEWYAHYPLALKGGLDPKIADAIAAGKRPEAMKDDEAALYDLATGLYRDKKVSDPVYKAALEKFGERGIMDIIGIIGYYDLVSMTLITMQAGMPDDKVTPLPALTR